MEAYFLEYQTGLWFHLSLAALYFHRDTILFTETTWHSSPPTLLVQPSPSGRKPDGQMTHLPRLRKRIRLRQSSISTSHADVLRHRLNCARMGLNHTFMIDHTLSKSMVFFLIRRLA